jgi:SPP1 gp7 family putative phage head morphogenesis protein
VRAGEIEAAKEQGIDDFVWTAVIDERTDECCLWRDGLLVSEIEAELNGDHSGDDCDSTVPPAHINCRCRVLPVSAQYVEQQQTGFQGIDEWLAS